ncbi:unnamed protein product [Parnassius apollo]|uniref:(apollo) hypothetical protein n=1 Tax=Parnassius apollo TaxID=110799 RepID=A0A8S3WMN4_PARAO|nr:unnamed protein product [Parnassius apollo]
MAIVQLLMEMDSKHCNEDFKIIYMAPIKALCTERLTEWYPKFTKLNLLCIEVTGDTDVDFSQLKPYSDTATSSSGTSAAVPGTVDDVSQHVLDVGYYTGLNTKIDDDLKKSPYRLLKSPWMPEKTLKFPDFVKAELVMWLIKWMEESELDRPTCAIEALGEC